MLCISQIVSEKDWLLLQEYMPQSLSYLVLSCSPTGFLMFLRSNCFMAKSMTFLILKETQTYLKLIKNYSVRVDI